jgi:hypothetical protein
LSDSIKRNTKFARWIGLFEDGVTGDIKGIPLRLLIILLVVSDWANRTLVNGAPALQDVLDYFFFVFAHKFHISPDSLFRTVYLVHNKSHQNKNYAVNTIISLERYITTPKKELNPDVGPKHEDKQDQVSGHPSFISHDLRVVSETVTDPDKGYE